jgi:hypothetical protein
MKQFLATLLLVGLFSAAPYSFPTCVVSGGDFDYFYPAGDDLHSGGALGDLRLVTRTAAREISLWRPI